MYTKTIKSAVRFTVFRHCAEHSDKAIQFFKKLTYCFSLTFFWIASFLAMTVDEIEQADLMTLVYTEIIKSTLIDWHGLTFSPLREKVARSDG
jgi:hypothetical protein